MELSKEFIEANGFEQNQVEAITNYITSDLVPTIKKDYDTKANDNAEGILTGAAKYAKKTFGVDIEREQGEKFGDYLQRISESGFNSKTEALKIKEAELEEKLKNFKGSDELKEKYEAQLAKNDALLKQVAELEPLKGLDEKYGATVKELSGLKLEVAFNKAKPVFAKEINAYEAKAKWAEFQSEILEKYNIELVDGEPIAIDKENEHKRKKLSELVSENASITELTKARSQKGTGAQPADLVDVEGVPFKVPQGATSEEQSALAREYLIKKLGDAMHKDFSKEMVDLLIKIKKASSK